MPVRADPEPTGHAIELRINAEDVGRGFLPSTGTITTFVAPSGPGVRVDTGVRQGSVVSPHFDSLLAKVIVHGRDRQEALRRARRAVAEMEIAGVATVLPFHRAVLRDPDFTAADRLGVYTTWIEHEFAERVAADPDFHDGAPAGRRRVVVDVDGRRVVLGLPADLLAGLAGAGAGGAGRRRARRRRRAGRRRGGARAGLGGADRTDGRHGRAVARRAGRAGRPGATPSCCSRR